MHTYLHKIRGLLGGAVACAALVALLLAYDLAHTGSQGDAQSALPGESVQLAAASAGHSAAGSDGLPPAQPMPACAGAGEAVALPSDFPVQFPFPPGTVISQSQSRAEGRVLSGVAPSDPHSVAVFLSRELPYRGFKSGIGDSEPGEAESTYAGYGYQGRWKVRSIAGCPGAVTFTVFAGR